MDCNIIRDLIPLYIDDCCSEESKEAVKAHLEGCEKCKKLLNVMSEESEVEKAEVTHIIPSKIKERQASVLQAVTMFVFFGLITFGVAKEAATPSGFGNGFWAFSVVVPATGFMLSLANWFFVRFYKNRRVFSDFSSIITFLFCITAFIWSLFHYKIGFVGLFKLLQGAANTGLIDSWRVTGGLFGMGWCLALSILFSILSKILSNLFAKKLGKD